MYKDQKYDQGLVLQLTMFQEAGVSIVLNLDK